MNINEVKLSIIRSVLKDCGKVVESLSESANDYNTNSYYEELLSDIDRSINILNGKELDNEI
jgi:hypothetical protein